MKYFLALLLLTSMSCFAQDYKALIAEHRKGYMEDFLKDNHSPLKKDDLQFLRFYDADSTYRVTAKAEIFIKRTDFSDARIQWLGATVYTLCCIKVYA